MTDSVRNEIHGPVTGIAFQIGTHRGQVRVDSDAASRHMQIGGVTIRPGDGDVLAQVVAHLETRTAELRPLLPHTQGALTEIQTVLDLIMALRTG